MKKFAVSASLPYEIIIGDDLIKNAGEYIKNVIPPCKLCVITDSNVNSLYAQVLLTSLIESGYQVSKVLFPAGEHSKNINTYANIMSALADEGITRSDAVIALGGGIVGDLTGFVASTYMRGIPYIQIPTTLIAALDSSVGGKTGINLQNGKNLAGTFWQPSLVLTDYKAFDTLPNDKLLDGYAEAVKCALISESNMIPHILNKDFEYVIERCISIKKSFVEVDETDQGIRQILNFGHTIGHAIEKYSSYNITHGQAIAKGMLAESRAAYRMGLTDCDISTELDDLLTELGFDTSLRFNPEEIYQLTTTDEKICNGNITVIVPKSLGKCELQRISLSKLKEYVSSGFNA